VGHDIFHIIPYVVGVAPSFSLRQDIIGRRQSKTTGQTLREKVIARQFARANNGILPGDCAVLDTAETPNDLELKEDAEEC